jgi:hypothetical protein
MGFPQDAHDLGRKISTIVRRPRSGERKSGECSGRGTYAEERLAEATEDGGAGWAPPAEEEAEPPELAEEKEAMLVRRVRSSEWPEEDGWLCLLEPAGVDGRLLPRKAGECLGEDPGKGEMLTGEEWLRSSLRACGGKSWTARGLSCSVPIVAALVGIYVRSGRRPGLPGGAESGWAEAKGGLGGSWDH